MRRAIHAAADLPDKCAISPLRRELPLQKLAKHGAQKLISAAAPIASPRSSPFRKNNPLYENQNPWIIPPIPLPPGGAYRDRHGRGARDAMDARVAHDECRARGRLNRMVLAPRCWRQVPAGRCAGATGANKPGTPGRVRHRPLKPIAQGRPACFGVPVVTTLVCFLLHTRLRVRSAHPAFPAPSDFSGGHCRGMTRVTSRGTAEVCL